MKLKLIMLLLFCLILMVGCSPKKEVVPPPVKIDCPAPVRPILVQTSTYEPKVFFDNFNLLVEYSLYMEKTIECYQKGVNK